MLLKITTLILCCIICAEAQENAGKSISPSLIVCYNNTDYLNRSQRPPATINVLIDLIRKIETGPSIQNDREISKELIHRFKQDGIIRGTTVRTVYSIPYTPKGFQVSKHRLLLQKFIPGSAVNFPNETLTELEQCSFHFMLSNSFYMERRENEIDECKKLDRFQMRTRRDLKSKEDVEVFKPFKSSPRKGYLEEDVDGIETPNDVETNVRTNPNSKSGTFDESSCPLENGAVYTKWGTIQFGTLLSAIATGIEPVEVMSKNNYKSNSIYATTLAGDLAEAGLHQGAKALYPFSIGAKGNWNGTQTPRWYFINKNVNLEITDAEIRAGLDGLIIAKNIQAWRNKANPLKVSQVLDMYYSPRGVFSKKYRACNRQIMYTEVAPTEELNKQTIAFAYLLDEETTLDGTIDSAAIEDYSVKAVKELNNYIASLRDLNCAADEDVIERISTDILIIVDSQWNYDVIEQTIGYLLDNLDVNKFGSNYTIINGKTGSTIVNSTYSIVDFYEKYNRSTHLLNSIGFSTTTAFNKIEEISEQKLRDNKVFKRGGKSSIVLFIPYNPLEESDKAFANAKKDTFKTSLPDLKLFVLGKNAKQTYRDLVVDANYDAIDLMESTDGTGITQAVNEVINRIKQVHRRVLNPNCGANWTGDTSSDNFDEYVEPNGINYYRLLPNYFYGSEEKHIKVQGYGYGNLQVCTSRQHPRPSQNVTQGDIKCEPVTGNQVVTFTLTDGCRDYDSVTTCPPLYFSIKATTNESSTFMCRDTNCRFPDSIKYSLQLKDLVCRGGARQILANSILVLNTFIISIYYIFKL